MDAEDSFTDPLPPPPLPVSDVNDATIREERGGGREDVGEGRGQKERERGRNAIRRRGEGNEVGNGE